MRKIDENLEIIRGKLDGGGGMPKAAASEYHMMMPGAVSKKAGAAFDSINFTTNQ
jgi:hypothetical protein